MKFKAPIPIKKQKKLESCAAIIRKLFETNSSFHVKYRTTGMFLLVLTKFSFWQEDWALGYHSMKIKRFPDIS